MAGDHGPGRSEQSRNKPAYFGSPKTDQLTNRRRVDRVMFKNVITDGLEDSGERVSIHRINGDTEVLQLTPAGKKTYFANTFGRSVVASRPMRKAAHSTHGMRDASRRSVMPLYGNSNLAVHPAADAALQRQSFQPLFCIGTISRFPRP
jgi:hypothetical protein